MYLATHARGIRDAVREGLVGLLAGPHTNTGRAWLDDAQVLAFDNGCFGSRYVGDDAYLAWLADRADLADRVLFAVAPDVVGDHAATLERSARLLPEIRSLGYRVAFVAQDGATPDTLPWSSFDVLFLGGTDAFKLGPDARACVREATARGVPVHMGRVNSERRFRYAAAIGCVSSDGTYLTFGPDTNIPNLRAWMRGVTDEPLMPEVPA